jgi:hypothetical protein
MLAVSLGYTGYLQRQVRPDAAYSGTQLVPLLATRSAEPARVMPAAADSWVVLLVDPGFEPYEDYRAILVAGDSGQVVWEVAGLEPGYEELLAVGVAAAVLKPGRYELRVEARNGAAAFAEITRMPIAVPESEAP